MDHREGKGRGVPYGGYVPQDRPACLGSPLLESSSGFPTNSAHPGDLQRQATGNGAGGHHGRDGGNSRGTTSGVSGARMDGFHQLTTLADAVWGGEYGA